MKHNTSKGEKTSCKGRVFAVLCVLLKIVVALFVVAIQIVFVTFEVLAGLKEKDLYHNSRGAKISRSLKGRRRKYW